MDSRQRVAAVRWHAGSLSSRSYLSARAVLFDPGEPDDCSYPLLHRPCWLRPLRRISHSHFSVSRLIRLRFRFGSHLRGLECFAGRRCRRPRPSRYMSNGRLHGGLLSFHEIKPVSLTHQRTQSPQRRVKRKSAERRPILVLLFSVCSVGSVVQPLFTQRSESRKHSSEVPTSILHFASTSFCLLGKILGNKYSREDAMTPSAGGARNPKLRRAKAAKRNSSIAFLGGLGAENPAKVNRNTVMSSKTNAKEILAERETVRVKVETHGLTSVSFNPESQAPRAVRGSVRARA
jgi:hypothetical protein